MSAARGGASVDGAALARGLADLGVRVSMAVELHASPSAFGLEWLDPGPAGPRSL